MKSVTGPNASVGTVVFLTSVEELEITKGLLVAQMFHFSLNKKGVESGGSAKFSNSELET